MKYRPEIDGLRALAVLPVVLFHAGVPFLQGGFVGVDIFFVISGYLITSIISEDVEHQKFSIKQFYERRIRRIFPAFLFVAATCVPFAIAFLAPHDQIDFAKSLVAASLSVSNILFWRETGYFDSETTLKPLLHTWSLGVEEQFYLFFPWILVFSAKWRLRSVSLLLLIGSVCSFVLAQWLSTRSPATGFYLLPSRAWELLFGAFAAIALRTERFHALSTQRWKGIFAGLGLLLIALSVAFIDERLPYPSHYTLGPVVGTVLIILFARQSNHTGRLLAHPVLVQIGLISYSAYLWHQPLFAFARHLAETPSPPFAVMASMFVLTFVLAYASWRWVEAPFRTRSKVLTRQVFTWAGVGTVSAVFTGALMLFFKGNLFGIYSPDQIAILGEKRVRDDYLWSRYAPMKQAEFAANKKKVLVVGDSFAADLINMMHHGQLDQDVSFSVHQIVTECPNLLVDLTAVERHIPPTLLGKCEANAWKNNLRLKRLATQADVILLASNWQTWQVPLIPGSLNDLSKIYGDKFIFIGSKSFGKIDLRKLALTPVSYRSNTPTTATTATVENMIQVKAALPKANFFDLQESLCGGSNCPAFTDAGKLISYDGAHFTEDGAKWAGPRLRKALSVAIQNIK